MKTLQEFLNANAVEGLTKEIAVSERLRDENGELYKFKIKAITHDGIVEVRKKASKLERNGEVKFDMAAFNRSIVINYTLEPNFKDSESLKKVGVSTPEQYLNNVLLAGEIERLADSITEFSGFGQNINELIEESKN